MAGELDFTRAMLRSPFSYRVYLLLLRSLRVTYFEKI